MATSSYQAQNSYQELDLKPFQLDYSSVLKEASAKTSYWMEGAAKIQQTYSKITGLAPQFIKNKEALNEFNSQVKDKIKKLAGTDLGIQGNANMLNDVIAPLYDTSNEISEAILLDDSYNKAGQSLMKEIENYKTKDKGVGYSQDNERYATEWYQEYLKKSRDPNASLNDLRELRSKVRSYIPYYDVLPTIKDAIAKCPENKSSVQNTGSDKGATGYFVTSEFTSKNSIGCIQSMLSMDPKAQQQFAISGSVRYGHNYEVLGKDFKEQALEVNTNTQKEIGRLKAQSIKTGITPEEQKAIEQQIVALESEVNDNNDYIKRVDLGDFKFIEEGYERFATSVYTRNKIKDFQSFNKNPEDNKVIKLSSDTSYWVGQKINNDNNQAALDRQHEVNQGLLNRQFQHSEKELDRQNAKELAVVNSNGKLKLDANGKLVTTDGSVLPEEFRIANVDENDLNAKVIQTENTFKAEKTSIGQSKQEVFNQQKNILNNIFNKNLKNEQDVKTFLDELKKDPTKMQILSVKAPQWDQYASMMDDLLLNEALHNSQERYIEAQIAKDPSWNEKVTIKTAQGNFTTPIKNIKNHIIYKSAKNYYTDSRGITHETESAVPYFIDANHKTPIRVINSINQEYNKSNEIRNKYYNKAKTYSSQEMSTGFMNTDEDNKFRNNIYDQLSGIMVGEKEDKQLVSKISDIRTGYVNKNKSTIEVIIPTPKDEQGKVLQQLGTNDKKVTYKGNGVYTIQYRDMKSFPVPVNMVDGMNNKLATILSDIESYPEENGTKIDIIQNFKGYKVHAVKGTPGQMWITSPKGDIISTSNVTEAILMITGQDPSKYGK